MATIFNHQKMPYRLVNWARLRKKELGEQIAQLQLESELMAATIARFEGDLCGDCGGAGNVMKPIKGCECDGPRQHTCETCKGTGRACHSTAHHGEQQS